ncbi:MAG: sulfatase [Sedimentisphaerales bacterium]|nr:sulfatase [Sedimentisphaerales bacterium]
MLSRRTFLKAAGICAAAGGLSLPFYGAAARRRPNIVLIIGDDISMQDHGVYGHPTIKTPHIDELAAHGLRFNNAYLTAASCSPTRCSVITGRYPHNTGAPELHMPLPKDQVMFPRLLKDSGYYTAAAGKWHLGPAAKSAFDRIVDSSPSGAERWVQTLRQRPKDKPFLMWFASYDAHRDWDGGPGAEPPLPKDAVVPPYQVDSLPTRQDIARYMGEVQRLDSYVGKVVDELKDQGILDNTLIIYMSDNGRAFPRDKAWLLDAAIKMPLIIHWPEGLATAGMVSDAIVSAIDIAPTLLEAAQVSIPKTMQGLSFGALFKHPKTTIRDYAFAELNWHTQYSHMRALRWKHYVYIRNAAPELSNMMMAKLNRRNAPWMELLRVREEGTLNPAQANVMLRPRPAEELYDVKADRHQLTNLAGQDKYQAVLDHLRHILDRWTAETGDTIPSPELRTPDRYDRHTAEETDAPFNPERRDWAGKARNAEKINAPGPQCSDKAAVIE